MCISPLSFLLRMLVLVSVSTVVLAETTNDCEGLCDALIPPGVYADEYLCETECSIQTSPGVVVDAGSDMQLHAPNIQLAGSFKVGSGARLSAGQPAPNSIANPLLTGHVLAEATVDPQRYPVWSLDVKTGRYTLLPGETLYRLDERLMHDLKSESYVSVSQNGSEYFEVGKYCYTPPGYDGATKDCVVYRDRQGRVTGLFFVPLGIRDSAFSRDSQHVALVFDFDSSSDGEYELRIYDRSGTVLDTGKIRKKAYDAFSIDWLPDGRLIYAHLNQVYITEPYSVTGTPLITLPHIPRRFLASPDGRRLLLELFTDKLDERRFVVEAWMLDIDDPVATLHRVAYDPLTKAVVDPLWSPDGKWIMVIQDGGAVNWLGLPPALYAVPANGHDVSLQAESTSAIPVLTNWYWDINGHHDTVKLSKEFRGGYIIGWGP